MSSTNVPPMDYVIQGREYKGHTRPKRPFRTEIYYMGVVKNRELSEVSSGP